jgi:ParB family chromosome partitioning protein
MNGKRKALGRGLSSLIPDPQPVSPLRAPVEIDLDRIRPNPLQPRSSFDEEAILALANSLKNNGVLQPVLVRPAGDGQFELVAGERRWRAAERAGLTKIPAVVRDIPDDRLLEHALIENLQRQDLDPIEEALAYRTLIEKYGLTQQQVADRVGKQRATVANCLRLLSLPDSVQQLVRSRELSMGHARALAGLEDAQEQERLGRRAVREDLSVRQLELLVSKRGQPQPRRAARSEDPNVLAAQQALQSALATKVRIVRGRRGGWIELRFYGDEELDRLYRILMRGSGRKP